MDDATTDDGILEADAAAAAGRKPHHSNSLGESQRFELQLEREAQQNVGGEGPLEPSLRAMQDAERLGQEAERGLASELAREGDADSPASPKGDADPYGRQLEAEIEDHLCELRLEERQHAEAAERQRQPKSAVQGADAKVTLSSGGGFSPAARPAGGMDGELAGGGTCRS